MQKTYIILAFIFLFCSSASTQSLKDLSFGRNSSFDIITWNIEWFPKNGQITIDSVSKAIQALDVDLLALQEINDTTLFKLMVDNLAGYETYFKSYWFGGLAYIYKTSTINILDVYEIYYTAPYWNAFPRSPMIIELEFNNDFFIIINNHFKCCGDGILHLGNNNDEEYRRFEASSLLKTYIDSNFQNQNVIVLGDLNDILTDDQSNNVFQEFLNDSAYMFADMNIALGNISNWSYPSWPSHLDHILITDELFIEFENDSSDIQTILVEDYLSGGFSEYNTNISDHRPVGLKIYTGINTIEIKEQTQIQKKEVIKTLNVLGQVVSPSSNTIQFFIYNDGTIDKIFKFK